MDKLQMAHEMALAIQGTKLLHDMELVSDMAWKYADAMQAEAEKRVNKERPEALREVDWSVAPEWAAEWNMSDGTAHWLSKKGCKSALAPTFGFTGSHIVERPQ